MRSAPGASDPRRCPPEVRAACVEALGAPGHAHAICGEYRAAATLDRAHDAADLAAGRRIRCPLLALRSDRGGLASWYAGEGGVLALWRAWAADVRGQAVPGEHFFPEETAARLREFFVPAYPARDRLDVRMIVTAPRTTIASSIRPVGVWP